MKAKEFDCVEMMHRGAEEIRKKIRGMTKKEEDSLLAAAIQKIKTATK